MKVRKIIRYFLIAILLLIIAFCLYNVAIIAKSFVDIDKELKQVRAEFIVDEAVEDDGLVIKWDELLNKNKDVVAWIDIPGTNISYPIVQGKDNNEYLRHNLDKEYSKTGSIFVDYLNINPFSDYNTVVYGHNLMNNSSMFSELKKFSKQDFADEYNSVFIYFPDESFLEYKVLSFHKVDALKNQTVYNTLVVDKAEFLTAVKKNNYLNYNKDENEISSVLTLSTCTNFKENERYVLHAVLLNEEKNDNK